MRDSTPGTVEITACCPKAAPPKSTKPKPTRAANTMPPYLRVRIYHNADGLVLAAPERVSASIQALPPTRPAFVTGRSPGRRRTSPGPDHYVPRHAPPAGCRSSAHG